MSKHLLHLGSNENGGFDVTAKIAGLATAILASRGAGKSYTGAVLAEELDNLKLPIVIIDPTGAHWGIKSSADGITAGRTFVIFGGDHADLPIETGSGELIARAFCTHRFSCVLDCSNMRKSERVQFVADFLETLYRLNKEAMYLIADEADVYAPQKPFGNEARSLGAMEDIVRRGRIKGIGCALITQRPQVIAKDVLTQCEAVFAMRMSHPKDIGAIREWVDVHSTPENGKELERSLPTLKKGEGWFWAPSLGILERVKIRKRWTYDSGRTPELGEKLRAPNMFSGVDLSKLGADIKALAEKVKQDDPKALRAEIARLNDQLALKTTKLTYQKVPVFNQSDRALLETIHGRIDNVFSATKTLMSDLITAASDVREILKVAEAVKYNENVPEEVVTSAPSTGFDMKKVNALSRAPVPARDKGFEIVPQPYEQADGTPITGTEKKILNILASWGTLDRGFLATHALYSPKGGGFVNLLSALRNKEGGAWIESSGSEISITDRGLRVLGKPTPVIRSQALVDAWCAKLGKAERSILTCMFKGPSGEGWSKQELAEETGYAADGGGFVNALSHLRSLGLIHTTGSFNFISHAFLI